MMSGQGYIGRIGRIIGMPSRVPGNLTLSEIMECKQMAELYRALANESPGGVYIVQDGRFQFVNPRFQEYTGYTEKELFDIDPLSIVHPEDREQVRECAVAMLKGRRFYPYRLRVIGKGGKIIWATTSICP